MVSIRNQSPSLNAILANGRFAVNVLGAHQHDISDVFAGRPKSGERFDFGCADFAPGGHGCPVLDDALAALECSVWKVEEIHDHTLIFGMVEACYDDASEALDLSAPLTYCRGRYGAPQPLTL
jgi:flavin reductase (DIM6/NTAB) family NADH-FMN oxidoreductase RutF